MQRIILVLLIIFVCDLNAYSQSFSINTDNSLADTSAILDVKSSAKGMLIPRMTKTQRNTIFQPAAGLMVFQNGPDSTGFYFYDGSKWLWMISTGNMQGADSTSWKRTGNTGTNPASNFVGTTDNQPLSFRVNNIKAGSLDHINHNTSLGAGSALNYTGSNSVAVGDSTLFSGTTGSGNVAVGHAALRFNTTGNDNAAFGNNSLYNTTTGVGNTGAGSNSLQRPAVSRTRESVRMLSSPIQQEALIQPLV
jgi:trimeric autotransporter adhesin